MFSIPNPVIIYSTIFLYRLIPNVWCPLKLSDNTEGVPKRLRWHERVPWIFAAITAPRCRTRLPKIHPEIMYYCIMPFVLRGRRLMVRFISEGPTSSCGHEDFNSHPFEGARPVLMMIYTANCPQMTMFTEMLTHCAEKSTRRRRVWYY